MIFACSQSVWRCSVAGTNFKLTGSCQQKCSSYFISHSILFKNWMQTLTSRCQTVSINSCANTRWWSSADCRQLAALGSKFVTIFHSETSKLAALDFSWGVKIQTLHLPDAGKFLTLDVHWELPLNTARPARFFNIRCHLLGQKWVSHQLQCADDWFSAAHSADCLKRWRNQVEFGSKKSSLLIPTTQEMMQRQGHLSEKCLKDAHQADPVPKTPWRPTDLSES